MTKLLWHSNAGWTPTGYGQQTALFTSRLNKHYDVGISAFYGLEGSPINYQGMPVFPGAGGDFGNGTLPLHAEQFFGSRRGGIVLTLCDVWPLDPQMASTLNMTSWCPVDHDPAPPQVVQFLAQSGSIPIAMSRHGQGALSGLDPLYVPHGVETDVYRPRDRDESRGAAFPKDSFVVGMVAANKGRPSRKAFTQALIAFARFASNHQDAYLYLHTIMDSGIANGENLSGLLVSLGIPSDRVRISDQYAMLYNPYSPEDMSRIYSAMDVLLNPSFGEGFGVPVLEAQACGTPAIVTDFTAMTEVCGAGWKVGHQPYWSGLSSWQAIPNIDEIVDALEECYELSPSARGKLAHKARQHALPYDADGVLEQHWLPALREVEARFEKRSVFVGGRRKWSVTVVTPWQDHPEYWADYMTAIDAAKPDELIIVDDASETPVETAAFRFDESVGFHRICNKGLELATSDVVVFLNNDIKLVDPLWLDRIVALCEPGALVGEVRTDPHTVIDGVSEPYIDGFCLAGMRTDLEALGGFDESFAEPSYWGDNDLCLRAKLNGMRLVDIKVGLEHLVNGTNTDGAARELASEANRELYAERVRASRRQAVAA